MTAKLGRRRVAVDELSTSRLWLRPPTMQEVEEYARVWGDADVTRYLPGGRPRSPEQAERGLQSYLRHWEEHGFGPWSLYLRPARTWVGYCGLRHLPEMGEVELLYGLDPGWWNRGLTTEAAQAAVTYGFETAGLERIIALAHPQNIASTRVMEHVGMRFEGVVEAFGFEVVQYALSRAEYEERGAMKLHNAAHDLAGFLKDADTPDWETPEATAEWVRSLRRESDE